ncbi:hypothetical protein BSL78_13374 [Apostichopus japonicus]|uniref:Uncharacterized protein n=1 Tax=Stichopus japonicus TaxID=307972 RepID=A0A2G8KP10_STIJA|nr:hypothetical protein BSL78_13374 [Apostichopus japonicus]
MVTLEKYKILVIVHRDQRSFEVNRVPKGGQSGYIQSRLKNIRRHLSTDDKQRPRCKTKIDQSTDKQIGLRMADLPTVEEDEAKRLSTFCRSAPVESKDAILSAMKKSTGNRMSWIKQDGPSVTEILKQYPQYIEIPELITQDFEQMFGTDIGHNFLLKWGQHASKVLAYISSSKNPTLVDLKDEYQASSKSEELSALYGLLGLIHLLPSFNTRKKGKCSREEVIQFFLDNQPIGTSVEDYTNKASAEGIIRRQPYLLGIGNAHEIQQFFIIVDRRAIPTSRQSCNIVAATDVLFKFYYIFNLDYPPQLEDFFIYLQTEIYNIPVHPGQKLANRVKEIKVALQMSG